VSRADQFQHPLNSPLATPRPISTDSEPKLVTTSSLLAHVASQMRSLVSVAALIGIIASPVLGVCPGFNFALQDRGNQNCTFCFRSFLLSFPFSPVISTRPDNIFDDSCNGVQTYIYTGVNACTQGTLTCSPPPVTITGAKINGLWFVHLPSCTSNDSRNLTCLSIRYACRADPNSGSCAGHFNNYCCRNDGN